MPKRYSDEEFMAAWREHGSPAMVARALGLSTRGVYERRRRLENKLQINLSTSGSPLAGRCDVAMPSMRRCETVRGTVVVFSDAHFWPGEKSVAYKALLTMVREMKPAMVVANGDVFDGARISRQPPIGWEKAPRIRDEIDACRERMDEIRSVSRSAMHVWTWGNHDLRLARYLAHNASHMEDVVGAEITDHVRHWDTTWSLMLNDQVMIKHRWHGGVHAAWNNVVKGGLSIVTGHTHMLEVKPFSDYRGRRYGVQTGTLMDLGPANMQTLYAEDNPAPHCGGFAVLTFDRNGRLLPPELVEVIDGKAYFRGRAV